jgi:hypothetical protein
MVIDSGHRPANTPSLCGRALKRSDVVGTPLAKEVFELIDASGCRIHVSENSASSVVKHNNRVEYARVARPTRKGEAPLLAAHAGRSAESA